jgi:hypothetical protein
LAQLEKLVSDYCGNRTSKPYTKIELGMGLVMYGVYLKIHNVDVQGGLSIFRIKIPGIHSRIRNPVRRIFSQQQN